MNTLRKQEIITSSTCGDRERLVPGGRFLLKERDPERRVEPAWNRAQEALASAVRLTLGRAFSYESREQTRRRIARADPDGVPGILHHLRCRSVGVNEDLLRDAADRQVAGRFAFAPPAGSTFFETNVSLGNLATSKKSGLIRWASRLGSRVLTDAASICTLISGRYSGLAPSSDRSCDPPAPDILGHAWIPSL